MKKRHAAVVVVGDLARSPRMLNHARELAGAGFRVSLIGYRLHELEVPEGVEVRALRHAGRDADWSAWRAGARMTRAFAELLQLLLDGRPDFILAQNPPSFPTLAAAWIAARLLRARLVVDWHNYGYSMLGLRLGAEHRLTRWMAGYERWMARRASDHFCVSQAMQVDMGKRFGVKPRVLYDRPLSYERGTPEGGVVVCPSGWTADEDMELLLAAIERLRSSGLQFYLTGEGPRRGGMFTGYLKEAEYRQLLRRAWLGLSLHRSSSGVDLPMKIVDLFAAGVPVCALDYGPAIREQVSERTGLLFRTAEELAALLGRLEKEPAVVEEMRRSVQTEWQTDWRTEWLAAAGPVFGVQDGA